MNVLLLGSGGREHALAQSISISPLLSRLYAAPGNPGIAEYATCLKVDLCDHEAVLAACQSHQIEFVIVGPEAPLVGGIVDTLSHAGILAFGPSRMSSQLEGSKHFTKAFCDRHSIPTAHYRWFDDRMTALFYLEERGAPIVVKADGLAAGKGVTVAQTIDEARIAVEAIFADPGASVVIEEVLQGREVSFFALADGARATAFTTAHDYKRVYAGDLGPNTGGMGAVSPARIDEAMGARIMREIVEPTIAGMAAEGNPFRGVLFAGLMIGESGPKLIEYNVRFGDPETQAMLPRLQDDLLALLHNCASGRLPDRIEFSDLKAVSVVLAAQGYPVAPRVGSIVKIGAHDAQLTLAGVNLIEERLCVSGGRILAMTGIGDSYTRARESAYAGIMRVQSIGSFYRSDIAELIDFQS